MNTNSHDQKEDSGMFVFIPGWWELWK